MSLNVCLLTSSFTFITNVTILDLKLRCNRHRAQPNYGRITKGFKVDSNKFTSGKDTQSGIRDINFQLWNHENMSSQYCPLIRVFVDQIVEARKNVTRDTDKRRKKTQLLWNPNSYSTSSCCQCGPYRKAIRTSFILRQPSTLHITQHKLDPSTGRWILHRPVILSITLIISTMTEVHDTCKTIAWNTLTQLRSKWSDMFLLRKLN